MSLSIIEKSMPSRKQCSRQSSRCSPSCSRANIRGVARRLWTVWNPPFILVDSVFDATVPRLMDFVYDTLKRVTLAAKEVIDETAAQSKSAILRNALATGRLNSRDIRLSLQYGINFFLRASEKEQLKSVIIKHEFTSVTRRLFQPLPQGAVGHPGVRHACSVDDSNCVVPIDVPAFELYTYGHVGFRRIMLEYNLTPSLIADSIMVQELKEFCNPAKSGSLFYVTGDSEFFLKTVRDYEARFFQSELLNDYYHNLANRKRSFLARYFGLFSYIQENSFLKLRFVIMSNIIPLTLPIHERYDLKGSTLGREASAEEYSKAAPTLKDNDFMRFHQIGFTLPAEIYDRLKETIQDDVEILRSWNIMDYSLLVGIRNLDNPRSITSPTVQSVNALSTCTISAIYGSLAPLRRDDDHHHQHHLQFDMAGKQAYSTMLDRLYSDVGTAPVFDNVDAKKYGGIPAKNEAGERVIIFLGIIDILQTYDAGKQFQNYLQGIQGNQSDDSTRSIIEPGKYAERFLKFIFNRVFIRGTDDLGTSRLKSLLLHEVERLSKVDPPYPNSNSILMPEPHYTASKPPLPYPTENRFPSPSAHGIGADRRTMPSPITIQTSQTPGGRPLEQRRILMPDTIRYAADRPLYNLKNGHDSMPDLNRHMYPPVPYQPPMMNFVSRNEHQYAQYDVLYNDTSKPRKPREPKDSEDF